MFGDALLLCIWRKNVRLEKIAILALAESKKNFSILFRIIIIIIILAGSEKKLSFCPLKLRNFRQNIFLPSAPIFQRSKKVIRTLFFLSRLEKYGGKTRKGLTYHLCKFCPAVHVFHLFYQIRWMGSWHYYYLISYK